MNSATSMTRQQGKVLVYIKEKQKVSHDAKIVHYKQHNKYDPTREKDGDKTRRGERENKRQIESVRHLSTAEIGRISHGSVYKHRD